MARRPPSPPRAEQRPTVLSHHGHDRVDEFHWLRDRQDPAVEAHLRAEDAYTRAALAPLGPLRRRLYAELRARIVETDLSVPVRQGPWWYYSRTRRGLSYPIHCRRPAARGQAPPRRPRRDDAEQVLLDENVLAQGHDFLQVGTLAVSPDHRWLAYGTDTTGNERHVLRFRYVGPAGAAAPGADEEVPDTSYGLAWAGASDTVFYTRVDTAMRPYQLWRHALGTDPGADELVLEEPDERFSLSAGRCRSGGYVVVALSSTDTSEMWLVPADDPSSGPDLVQARRQGVDYSVDHVRGRGDSPGWLVMLTNEGARDFRLLAAPAGGGDGWREVVAHREGTRLDDVDAFDDWLVLSERAGGEAVVRVAPLRRPAGGADGADPFGPDLLERSWVVAAGEHPSTTWVGPNPEPDQAWLRIEQTSLVSPRAVSDLDMAGGTAVLRKQQPVRGYDASRYRTFRLWATSADGTRVPVSVVHRADLLGDPGAPAGSPPAEPAPLLLYGYGAYEHSIDPVFSSPRLNLLDRGFVFAVAHVRGGGELGRHWYEDGRLGAKQHTFDDFLAVARHLVDRGFTTSSQLAIRGGSAGGLLIGAVLNQAPSLFRAAVAEVPFVDCLTTMLDPSLPLTVGEWEEWGNPLEDEAAYRTIGAYSPYDHVGTERYPELLVTAGLEDSRVAYWEPAKWVARLREANGANRVLLRIELGAGHFGPSGRYRAWQEEAFVQAFLLDALGVAGAAVSPRPSPAATSR